METVNVIQGEYAVATKASVQMTTVLGSCIAACVFDTKARIGGMNHFLLPGSVSGNSNNVKYGAYLMELLLNDLLKSGADRRFMRAKLYGGSKMNASIGNVGERNILFVQDYLRNESIPIEAEDLGGTQSRRITFQPTTGQVMLKVTKENVDLDTRPSARARKPPSDVLLF